MRKEIESQIKKITQSLTYKGIARATNYPKWEGNDLVWEQFKNLSFSLKNTKYHHLYRECLSKGDYNFVLLDGALIQMKYRFYKEEIHEHILSFYPSPFSQPGQNDFENFETDFIGEEDFDYQDEKIICTPLRFDFNIDDKIFKDTDHPKTHFTIGDYKSCRIPIYAPLTPNRFMKFILRNFYFEKFTDNYSDNFFKCDLKTPGTISINEKSQIHFNWQ